MDGAHCRKRKRTGGFCRLIRYLWSSRSEAGDMVRKCVEAQDGADGFRQSHMQATRQITANVQAVEVVQGQVASVGVVLQGTHEMVVSMRYLAQKHPACLKSRTSAISMPSSWTLSRISMPSARKDGKRSCK